MIHPVAKPKAGCDDLSAEIEQASCQYKADSLMDEQPEIIGNKRPCAWVRKHEYKKRLRSKYRIMHHWGDSQAERGMRLESVIYLDYGKTDWRTHGFVNYHQHLYLSARGDIRVIHGSVTAYPHEYMPFPTYMKKHHAFQANRRIRHMKHLEDGSLNYGWLKKMYTCFDDGF